MTAFDEAFTLLKVEHAFDLMEGHLLQKGKMDEAMELQAMREFVNVNAESADPAKRQAAEEMLRQLTQLMSSRRPDPVQIPPRPVGEGGIPTASTEHPAVEKAFDFLKKNVVGMQNDIEYSMPESVASMAQRPQVPEMQRGFFGRMKPTGQMNLGGPQTMDVQENAQNPMAGFGTGHPDALATGMGQMMTPPGAAVERMPHPSPFPKNQVPFASFAGQGYRVDNAGEFYPPSRRLGEDFINLHEDKPVGTEGNRVVGKPGHNTPEMAQAGDQFNRQTRRF